MLGSLSRKIFGSRNDRLVNSYKKVVAKVDAFEAAVTKLSSEELKGKTLELRTRYLSGTSLHALLPEAFALVREAAKRTLGLRHYSVQLIGGMVLFDGKIAEMRTGEGKTLSATLPAYLAAIAGEGVHLVTVNDYLAARDANWMRPVYEALGLSVGIINRGLEREEKKAAYNCDITYGTNNEFGFDYLRDNMVFALEEKMQRPLAYAIVDEVDSIFIDEARTPLIISGHDKDSSELYTQINRIIPKLTAQKEKDGDGDYSIDDKNKQVYLTEAGHEKVEDILSGIGLLQENESLYSPKNIALMHHVYAALRAHVIYKKDVDYIIHDGEVVIVDENTGRTMIGRRWSDGLHQAVEAKEKVAIQSENQTLASITFQNYFRLYKKLSGMTGTADTEAYELQQIYGTEVVVIPTNKASQRKDLEDLIYISTAEKFKAIVDDIKDCVARQQPVLVGTVSIEISEFLSKQLKNLKIKHNILNAKMHAEEARIISEAGRPGAVTIATNMAGRGTDIVLGGSLEAELHAAPDNENAVRAEWKIRHDKVISVGGLHIIGTERHESRRVDNQLRGRAGRQGDVGSTRFYLSVQDDLMRRFISPAVVSFLSRLNTEQGTPISGSIMSRGVENAQRKVEGHNFDIRKQLLEYDDVANEQRKVIYRKRDNLLLDDNVLDLLNEKRREVIFKLVNEYIPANSMHEEWDVDGLQTVLQQEFGLVKNLHQIIDENHLDPASLASNLIQSLEQHYADKELLAGHANMRRLEKIMLLNILDNNWKEHLAFMDYIRQSIHLRSYAQQDPKHEYKRESFDLFMQMLDNIDREFVSALSLADIRFDDVPANQEAFSDAELEFKHPSYSEEDLSNNVEANFTAKIGSVIRKTEKIGRNEPCHCGSGLKYKACHGIISLA